MRASARPPTVEELLKGVQTIIKINNDIFTVKKQNNLTNVFKSSISTVKTALDMLGYSLPPNDISKAELKLIEVFLSGIVYFNELRNLIEQGKPMEQNYNRIDNARFIMRFHYDDGHNLLSWAQECKNQNYIEHLENLYANSSFEYKRRENKCEGEAWQQAIASNGPNQFVWAGDFKLKESAVPLDSFLAYSFVPKKDKRVLTQEIEIMNFTYTRTKNFIRYFGLPNYNKVEVQWEYYKDSKWNAFPLTVKLQIQKQSKKNNIFRVTLHNEQAELNVKEFTIDFDGVLHDIRWKPLNRKTKHRFGSMEEGPFLVSLRSVSNPIRSSIDAEIPCTNESIVSPIEIIPLESLKTEKGNNSMWVELFHCPADYQIDHKILPKLCFEHLSAVDPVPMAIYLAPKNHQLGIQVITDRQQLLTAIERAVSNFNKIGYTIATVFNQVNSAIEKQYNVINDRVSKYFLPLEMKEPFRKYLMNRIRDNMLESVREAARKKAISHFTSTMQNYLWVEECDYLSEVKNSIFVNSDESIEESCNTILDNKNYDCTVGSIAEFIREESKSAINSAVHDEVEISITRLVHTVFIKHVRESLSHKTYLIKLPSFIKQSNIFIAACKSHLPIFKHANEIYSLFVQGRVLFIEGNSGIGKSVGLPILFHALRFEKPILITQPRRLQCTLLYNQLTRLLPPDTVRVSYLTETRGYSFAKIEVCQEDLLKERLIRSDYAFPQDTIVILDEVHERTTTTDLCVALLAKKLHNTQQSCPVSNIIITSTSIDDDIKQVFEGEGLQIRLNAETPFPITETTKSNMNVISAAMRYIQKLERDEQILCFLSSTQEVEATAARFNQLSGGLAKACGILVTQSDEEQIKNLKSCSIFFATAIVETSIVFPKLRYVLDTGKILLPCYDCNTQAYHMKEFDISDAAVLQRKGRLGRVDLQGKKAKYIRLYDEEKRKAGLHPPPQLHYVDLTDFEWQLRRINTCFKDLIDCKRLPTPPPADALQNAIDILLNIGLIRKGDQDYEICPNIIRETVLGTARMTRAVSEGIKYNCSYKMLQLAAVLLCYPSTAIIGLVQLIPPVLHSPKGDFMTALQVFDFIWEAKVKHQSEQKPFDVEAYCESVSIPLGKIASNILEVFSGLVREMCLERYVNNHNYFQFDNGNWEDIAKCLMTAYPERLYVNGSFLDKKKYQLIKYAVNNTNSKLPADKWAQVSKKSVLKDIVLEENQMLLAAVAIVTSPYNPCSLAWTGVFKTDILPDEIKTRRTVELSVQNEENDFEKLISKENLMWMKRAGLEIEFETGHSKNKIIIDGPVSSVYACELGILGRLRSTQVVDFTKLSICNDDQEIYGELLHELIAGGYMNCFFARWKNRLNFEVNGNLFCINNARYKYRHKFVEELKVLFLSLTGQKWLATYSSEIRKLPKFAGLQMIARVNRLCDPNRDLLSIWGSIHGPNANRATRMEAAAWIAICKFNCAAVGEFVALWVIGGENDPNTQLELEIPLDSKFDLHNYLGDLTSAGLCISKKKANKKNLEITMDENADTGPFTITITEPHIAASSHIAFDIFNLCCKKNLVGALGIRMASNHFLIDTCIENILAKKCVKYVGTNPVDCNRLIDNGWEVQEFASTLKETGNVLFPLQSTDLVYCKIVQAIKPFGVVTKVDAIINPTLEELYVANKFFINQDEAKSDPLLYYGTTNESVIKEIPYYSFTADAIGGVNSSDGPGARFAENPEITHERYFAKAPRNGPCVMFYCMVSIGSAFNSALGTKANRPPVPHNSIERKYDKGSEYAIYRCQALPLARVEYVPLERRITSTRKNTGKK